MQTTREDVDSSITTKYRDRIETNKYLGGMVQVSRVVSTEKLGDDLIIKAPNVDKVYINGIEYVRINTRKEK